ncbi:MAG TPA: protein-glutamate O-methyltransferase CheR [Fibrobacteria bacterium]|nr:protein-glutamate O-methyltransferase CheR [Fibrobacteria bacterium]HOX51218.1 protein-glutamate O-methyltransferase CheR [Fibrobacteria bacterium]
MKLLGGEFELMKSFVERNCGIHLEPGKEYLVETRLTDLALELGCRSFLEFHAAAQADVTGKLKGRIVDAMTTNETYFFRDDNFWTYMKEVAVPELLRKAASGPVRVWSAASSTGQEAYSVAMLVDETARAMGQAHLAASVEILGTDISSAALFLAISGRYDSLAIRRGLSDERRRRHFREDGSIWAISDELKSRVRFRRFNLMDPMAGLGPFDLVLCRYVAIYFQEEFKRDLFYRMGQVLRPGCALVLGATETMRGLSEEFDPLLHKNCTVYVRKTSR